MFCHCDNASPNMVLVFLSPSFSRVYLEMEILDGVLVQRIYSTSLPFDILCPLAVAEGLRDATTSSTLSSILLFRPDRYDHHCFEKNSHSLLLTYIRAQKTKLNEH